MADKHLPGNLEEFYKLNLMSLVGKNISEDVIGIPLNSKLTDIYTDFRNNDFGNCLDVCTFVLDFVWEQLNLGHWKDVKMDWRYVYYVVSYTKALSEYALLLRGDLKVSFGQVMKTCDMGLLMGAPCNPENNFLSQVCSQLTEEFVTKEFDANCGDIKEKVTDKISVGGKIDCVTKDLQKDKCSYLDAQNVSDEEEKCCSPRKIRRDNKDMLIEKMNEEKCVQRVLYPSLETFNRDFLDTQTPVIITGAMAGWPALSNRQWSLDYIKRKAGCRTVPIELGSKYTDETWSQKLMTVRDFIGRYIETSSGEVGYLAQHQLFNQIPELQDDIITPDYCFLGQNDDVDINAWFGPKGTVSPLHFDPKHNFLAQVLGEKYIRIYSVTQSEKLYAHGSTILQNTSQVDVEHPDVTRFPLFQQAEYFECILQKGEMLYIPPKYWHFVKSLAVSFSVSFWWD